MQNYAQEKKLKQPLNPFCNAVFLIGRAGFIGSFLYLGDGVLHGNSFSAEFKHPDVVKVVSKGGDFLSGKLHVIAERLDCIFFCCLMTAEFVPGDV